MRDINQIRVMKAMRSKQACQLIAYKTISTRYDGPLKRDWQIQQIATVTAQKKLY